MFAFEEQNDSPVLFLGHFHKFFPHRDMMSRNFSVIRSYHPRRYGNVVLSKSPTIDETHAVKHNQAGVVGMANRFGAEED